MSALETARSFFDACDYGEAWKKCKNFCTKDASFETEAETLTGVDRLDTYCDWMVEALAMFDESVKIEIKAQAYDESRDIVLVFAEISGNFIIGPKPMFAKTNYVYAIHFDGTKICDMTKVWELKLPS